MPAILPTMRAPGSEQALRSVGHLIGGRQIERFAIHLLGGSGIGLDDDMGGTGGCDHFPAERDVVLQVQRGAAIGPDNRGARLDSPPDRVGHGGSHHRAEPAIGQFLEGITGDYRQGGGGGESGFDADDHFFGSLMVSSRIASAPPAARPSICSRNASRTSSAVRSPTGSRKSPQGPDVAENPRIIPRGGARDLCGGEIEGLNITRAAVGCQDETRTSERVGGDRIAAGSAIGAVDGHDVLRAVDVPSHTAITRRHAAGEQQGAHAAIATEGTCRQFAHQIVSRHPCIKKSADAQDKPRCEKSYQINKYSINITRPAGAGTVVWASL